MRKFSLLSVAAALGIAVCASPQAAGLFSSTGPVIAMLGDALFLGEAEGNLDGSGTLVIQSQKDTGLSCQGQFTSSAELGGKGNLQCSDGAVAMFRFVRLTLRSGHGAGSVSRTPLSFTYGLTAEESRPYLQLPAGRTLELYGNLPRLTELPRGTR